MFPNLGIFQRTLSLKWNQWQQHQQATGLFTNLKFNLYCSIIYINTNDGNIYTE